jgi:hypothetical protein
MTTTIPLGDQRPPPPSPPPEASRARQQGLLAARRSALRSAEHLGLWGRPLLVGIIGVSFLHLWESIAAYQPEGVATLRLPDLAYHAAAAALTGAIDLAALYLVAANAVCVQAGQPERRGALRFFLGLTFLLNGAYLVRHAPSLPAGVQAALLPALDLLFVVLLPAFIPIAIVALEGALQRLGAARLSLLEETTALRAMLQPPAEPTLTLAAFTHETGLTADDARELFAANGVRSSQQALAALRQVARVPDDWTAEALASVYAAVTAPSREQSWARVMASPVIQHVPAPVSPCDGTGPAASVTQVDWLTGAPVPVSGDGNRPAEQAAPVPVTADASDDTARAREAAPVRAPEPASPAWSRHTPSFPASSASESASPAWSRHTPAIGTPLPPVSAAEPVAAVTAAEDTSDSAPCGAASGERVTGATVEPTQPAVSPLTLADGRLERLRAHPVITPALVMELLDCSEATATRTLRAAMADGTLRRERRGQYAWGKEVH